MIYGLIFDNFPLFNLHNQPYLLIASVSSLLGFLSLGFPALSNTPESTIAGFWFGLMGMAMCDVIADAMVVKHARDLGEKGGADLQTFCWIMQGIGSVYII